MDYPVHRDRDCTPLGEALAKILNADEVARVTRIEIQRLPGWRGIETQNLFAVAVFIEGRDVNAGPWLTWLTDVRHEEN